MKREEFDHVIRAAAAIVEDEIVVVGSQALHGEIVDPPGSLLVSREVDLYPRSSPERAEEIDGAIGEGSPFDSSFGYYAHGVGPETPWAPTGWEDRLIRVDVPKHGAQPDAVAWCLSMHDLVLAKLAAGRPHDIEFATEAVAHELVNADQLRLGLELMPKRFRDRASPLLDRVLGQANA